MDRDEHVCPVCGQTVATVVRRRKTLGTWVPVWGPGPCRNPQCTACVESAEEGARGMQSGGSAVKGAASAPPK
ncbi:hypothetical protein [Streptomyces spongiae]|uniref:Uncharacterized protein n=1 Tax=Streptomyces spongiae TaxID=565072 RepID=A0A5N8XYK8_9ACTN|nr:hypothetical protein [Streptomyces spongiae]MPY64437.1 hypothetical protein [Streptomyces spongiae]